MLPNACGERESRSTSTSTSSSSRAKLDRYVTTSDALAESTAKVEAGLANAPESLPPDLAALPLFKQQTITKHGFGVDFKTLGDDLRWSLVFERISRKTLFPAILHFLA